MWTMRLTRNPECVAQTRGDVTLVTAPGDATVHTLNETGTWIWERIDGVRTLAAIAAEMNGLYDVTPEELREDVFAFAQEAVAKNLLLPLDDQDAPLHKRLM